MLSNDGSNSSELARRLGIAKKEFDALRCFWQRSNMTQRERFNVYQALVLSKLMYGCESMTLRASEKRKLNGFHCACCRTILRIQPSYISRVSNKYVLKKLGTMSLENIVLGRQLVFFGKIARRESSDVLRGLVFIPSTMDLVRPTKRKQGRPRLQWSAEVMKHATQVFTTGGLESAISCALEWEQAVNKYCASLA